MYTQEFIQATKHRMVASVQDKIRRLHEDKIIAELTKGLCATCIILLYMYVLSLFHVLTKEIFFP